VSRTTAGRPGCECSGRGSGAKAARSKDTGPRDRPWGCMDGHRVSVKREHVDVQVFGDGEAAAVGVCAGHEVPPVEPEEIVWKSRPRHLKIGRARTL